METEIQEYTNTIHYCINYYSQHYISILPTTAEPNANVKILQSDINVNNIAGIIPTIKLSILICNPKRSSRPSTILRNNNRNIILSSQLSFVFFMPFCFPHFQIKCLIIYKIASPKLQLSLTYYTTTYMLLQTIYALTIIQNNYVQILK